MPHIASLVRRLERKSAEAPGLLPADDTEARDSDRSIASLAKKTGRAAAITALFAFRVGVIPVILACGALGVVIRLSGG